MDRFHKAMRFRGTKHIQTKTSVKDSAEHARRPKSLILCATSSSTAGLACLPARGKLLRIAGYASYRINDLGMCINANGGFRLDVATTPRPAVCR